MSTLPTWNARVPAVHLDHLCFSFTPRVEIFTDLSAHLTEGWTGLVGENGAGKSTLLDLIRGALQPTRGAVRLEPARAIVTHCPQRVQDADDAIEAFSYAWDRAAIRLRARLRLDDAPLDRWESLSPGERKRWQIGAALHARPDVLLLDEPTNHLDAGGRDLLLDALRRFRGVGVIVSHDRALLDGLTDATLRIHRGEGRLWSAPYADARDAWIAEEAELQRLYARASSEAKKLRRRLGDARRSQQTANQHISASSRISGPKDSDGRSMAAKGRAMKAAAALDRRSRVVKQQFDRAESHRQSFSFEKSVGRSLAVAYVPPPQRILLHVQRETVCAGEVPLLSDVFVAVERDSRVRISGENGAGKSTLLRALLASNPGIHGNILYLPQELPAEESARLLRRARDMRGEALGALMEIVAALGVDPARLLASEAPSPGEARKLAIATGLSEGAWALLLDEPTNHLDLPSIERLEAALIDYPGALVLISHDARFAAACTAQEWRVADGQVLNRR